jgi:hypothetical protein
MVLDRRQEIYWIRPAFLQIGHLCNTLCKSSRN